MDESALPRYDELPGPNGAEGAPRETTWGLFGDRYELGTLNFLTPERVLEATRLVKTGKRINLNLPLDRPVRPEGGGGHRGPYGHRFEVIGGGTGRDEILDGFNPQASSQWDGFAHVAHPRYRNYNGVPDEGVTPGRASQMSIGTWTANGAIVARGVLIDVPRHMAATGQAYDPQVRSEITPAILEATAARQGVEIKRGDILLVRTGVVADMLARPGERRTGGEPGLSPAREVAAFLWNHGITAVASDNTGLEPSPFGEGRSLHMCMLPMLGMPIGELWALDELAEDCAADGVYEFMLVSVPLYLPGGIGSPPNAIAIK